MEGSKPRSRAPALSHDYYGLRKGNTPSITFRSFSSGPPSPLPPRRNTRLQTNHVLAGGTKKKEKAKATNRRTIVRFDMESTIYHETYSRKDWTSKEIQAIWYSREDFDDILDEVETTVKIISAGLTDPDRGDFCFRGLENEPPDIRERRKGDKQASHRAVFDAQKQGTAADPMMEKLISQIYSCHTRQAAIDAQRTGLWDQRIAGLIWREDLTPTMPKRTWAKAG